MIRGDFRKDFPVELDAGFFESLNESGVGNAVFARGRIDADGPQAAKIAFFCFAVNERMAPCVQQALSRDALFGFRAMSKSLGVAQGFSTAF